MSNLLDGFNFISPIRNRSGRKSSSTGLSIKLTSRGGDSKSVTFSINKALMKKSGIVVGDRVNVGVKYNSSGGRYVFIKRSLEGAYAVSGMAKYRGKHANGQVKMAARDELLALDEFKCELSDIQFLEDGGFIAYD